MGISLKAAKPIYEQQLKLEFNDILENAFYEALKSLDMGEEDEVNNMSPEIRPVIIKANKKLNERHKKSAKKFAQAAAGDLAKAVAEKTYDFVKEIFINVNNAPVLPTLISPTGPCTGTLTILPTNFQIM
jgi:hypothetical protein